ncbi:MAG: RNA-binding protein [Thermodesulfovibrionales bacterium]|nr:RNA-binding protein [Thermodesulfovibrionales bacterium]
MGKRLYVGNVPYQATEEDLRALFSKAGEVVSVKLLTDAATGKLRGFGFVEMGSDEDTQKAITMFNKSNFMERSIVVNEAKPQEERKRRDY